MSKFQDIVAWTMPEDKILKLQNKNQTYDIADNVYEFLKGKDLLSSLEEKTVEVEINETQGQTGVITHLKVVDGKEEKKETPKEEPKQEVKKEVEPSVGLVVKEVTVEGVSVQYKGVTFKEEKDVWYTLDSTIDVNKFKAECTKKKIEVSILPTDKGNDVIKGYVLKEEEKKEEKEDLNKEPEQKMNDKDSFYRIKELERQVRFLENQKSDSFEAQNAVANANIVVAQMKDILLDPAKVLTTITKIAEHNFKTIQDLKNKE